MNSLALLSILVVAISAKWHPDPIPEGGTDLAVFASEPVVMQARKMAKLVPNQDVVTTCRYILFKQPLEYHDALDACLALEWPITNAGIGMATVRTEAENDDVSNLIRIGFGFHFDGKKPYKYGNWALIGLSKRRNNDYKIPEEEEGVFNAEDWWFSNGMRTNYTKWHKGFPDQQMKGKKNNREYQNWVQINKKGYWDDTYCSKKLPYLCEYCGKYIVLSKHVTWDKANAHCQDLGLEFAVVNSQSDNEELLFAARVSLGEELGGRRFNNSNWVWIGTQEIMDETSGNGTGVWQHWNGDSLDFSPSWDYKVQPDNWVLPNKGEQNVVGFSRKDGKWDDSFKFRKRPFACQCPHRGCSYSAL